MDKKGFIRYLKDAGVNPKSYSSHVAKFEQYLCQNFKKSLAEANENDVRACPVLTKNKPYAYAVKYYYEFLDSPNATEIMETIKNDIIPKIPKRQPPKVIRWTDFRYLMEQLEKKGISEKINNYYYT